MSGYSQQQGLHCIGLWYTHSEPSPVPSSDDDCVPAKEHALAAVPQLSGFVFVIFGTARFPTGLKA